MGRSGAPVASACGVNSGGPDTAKPRFTDFGDTVISALVPTAPHGGRSGLPPPGMSEPLEIDHCDHLESGNAASTPSTLPFALGNCAEVGRRLARTSADGLPHVAFRLPSRLARICRVYAMVGS